MAGIRHPDPGTASGTATCQAATCTAMGASSGCGPGRRGHRHRCACQHRHDTPDIPRRRQRDRCQRTRPAARHPHRHADRPHSHRAARTRAVHPCRRGLCRRRHRRELGRDLRRLGPDYRNDRLPRQPADRPPHRIRHRHPASQHPPVSPGSRPHRAPWQASTSAMTCGYYRTSSPVTALPMMMRWISDVPSK